MATNYATILFYMKDKAICEDSFGTLCYIETDWAFAEVGEVVEADGLPRVAELSEAEQAAIRQRMAEIPADELLARREGVIPS